MAYELDLLDELAAVHPVFCLSMLIKYTGDPTLAIPIERIGVKDSLTYEDVLVEILFNKFEG